MHWCLEFCLKMTHGIFASCCPEQVTWPCEMSQKCRDGQKKSLPKNSGPCTTHPHARPPSLTHSLAPISAHSTVCPPTHICHTRSSHTLLVHTHTLSSHSHPWLYTRALALGPIPLIHKHAPSELISPTRSLSHHSTHSCALLLLHTFSHSTRSTPTSTHTHNDSSSQTKTYILTSSNVHSSSHTPAHTNTRTPAVMSSVHTHTPHTLILMYNSTHTYQATCSFPSEWSPSLLFSGSECLALSGLSLLVPHSKDRQVGLCEALFSGMSPEPTPTSSSKIPSPPCVNPRSLDVAVPP